MQAIKAQGLLEPILDYLDREINRLQTPIEPTGAEWPFLRARQDGGIAVVGRLKLWFKSRSEPSPDGAENTED